jgi:sugar/nucleoside kinase (ribokinase family)
VPPAGMFVGLSTLDIVYRVVAPPGPDEKVQALAQELAAGGPAANAAVTFAALGGSATLVTALGRHALAGHVAAELASRGVTVVDATPERAEPLAVSSAYVVEATGERSVVSVNAAGADPAAPPELAVMAAGVPVVLLDGQHPRIAMAAATAARAAGGVVILDGGSWKPVLPKLLPLVDVAACSAAFRVPGTTSAAESAAALRERYGVPAVAMTAGPDPVRWWYADGSGTIPVPAVRARDTLGAGDAFHGAFAWALARDARDAARDAAIGAPAGLVAALELAATVAALRCESPGPRGWLADPRLADLAASLDRFSP